MVHDAAYPRGDGNEEQLYPPGIVEADETFVGGRPRKGNKRDDDPKDPEPVESKKTPVIGLVDRGGKVKAKMVDSVTVGSVIEFIFRNVQPEGSTLMTDENTVYNFANRYIDHKAVRHKEQYVDGEVHTNTLEHFWSLLKRAWFG